MKKEESTSDSILKIISMKKKTIFVLRNIANKKHDLNKNK
jgi:predicted CopG family antitoxin